MNLSKLFLPVAAALLLLSCDLYDFDSGGIGCTYTVWYDDNCGAVDCWLQSEEYTFTLN